VTARKAGRSTSPAARRGDLVVALADDGHTAAFEVGVVTRVRDGLAEAWHTADGAIRPARFVPSLSYRWIAPQEQVDVGQALDAVAQRTEPEPFGSVAEIRDAIRPYLYHDREIEAGS
jgi:hypothetical protein